MKQKLLNPMESGFVKEISRVVRIILDPDFKINKSSINVKVLKKENKYILTMEFSCKTPKDKQIEILSNIIKSTVK